VFYSKKVEFVSEEGGFSLPIGEISQSDNLFFEENNSLKTKNKVYTT
jgi:hypothetical protein